MNWNIIYVIAGVVLNVLVLGVWKPWAGTYTGEKGKNLARKEDIDKLVAEMRALTTIQEEIKSKLTAELWNRQMMWNQKLDLYVRLLNTVSALIRHFISMPRLMKQIYGTDPPPKQAEINIATEELNEANRLEASLINDTALASLFATKRINDAIDEYSKSLKPLNIKETIGVQEKVQSLHKLLYEIKSSAKEDLQIT